MSRFKSKERDIAVSYFERTIELDPSIASAHAGLADAHYSYTLLGASADKNADLERSLKASMSAKSAPWA